MTKPKKIKKIKSGDGFSLGEDGGALSVSLGVLLEKESEKEKNVIDRHGSLTSEDTGEKRVPPSEVGHISKLSKVSLQRRTAGCGGKTVTFVTIPKDAAIDLEALAKEMRKGLGCGSKVEKGGIFLQGDIVERVEDWFLKRGVKKIIKGN